MSQSEQIILNLIVNSACSFMAGILVVAAVIRLFRVGNSQWKLFLLSLPFVKIIWDIGRGIPSSSVIFSGINPLSLPPKSQTLTIGAGFSEFGPIFNLVFTANDLSGRAHSTSLADYIAALLMKYAHPSTPRTVLLMILGVSFFLIARRVFLATRFELKRKSHRVTDKPLREIRVSFRKVDVYISSAFSGTPFTGGIFHPYVCFPESTFLSLTDAEREAVIQHEIAHIRHWDLLATLAIKVLGDVFWFIPLYRFLSRKIDRLRELLADQVAVRAGASSAQLASALVKLREAPLSSHQPILYSAFFREPALLKIRVNELLGTAPTRASRLGWNNRFARVLIAAWTAGAVMIATFGGNHQIKNDPLPKWVERLIERLK
ncbi:MAG: M56 family metallopeptidase [Oligoflexia bacterium]